MSLPAELESLEQQYADFFASYQSGALSEADLRATADNLIAVDGNGARWKLNLDGEGFLRAWPGGPFAPAYPEEFAPLSVPPTVPFDRSDAFAWQTPPGQSTAPRPHGYAPREIDPAAPVYTEPATLSRAGKALGGLSAARSRWSGLSAKRRRVILVAAACALLLVALAARGGQEELPPATIPAQTTIPVPQDTVVPVPVEPVIPAEPSAAELPVGRIQEVVSALTSGDRAQILGVLADPGQPVEFWRKSAMWSGVGRIGLTIDSTSAPELKKDKAQQVWALIDSANGTPVLRAQVSWVFDGSTWKLATFPTLDAV
jgi:hypothetical protein